MEKTEKNTYIIESRSSSPGDYWQFSPPPETGFSLIYDFEIPEDAAENVEYVSVICNGSYVYMMKLMSSKFNFEVKIPVTYGCLFIDFKLRTPGVIPWLRMKCLPRDPSDTNFDTFLGMNVGCFRDIIVEKNEYGHPSYRTTLRCCASDHPCSVQLLWMNTTWLDKKVYADRPYHHNHDLKL